METEKTNQEPTLTIRLTTTDCQNLVAFGNRADMKGGEADAWVALKYKILRQVQEHADQAKREPQICAVPDNPGGTD